MGNKNLSCTEVCERDQRAIDELRMSALGDRGGGGEGLTTQPSLAAIQQQQAMQQQQQQAYPQQQFFQTPVYAGASPGHARYVPLQGAHTPMAATGSGFPMGAGTPSRALNLSSGIYGMSPAHQGMTSAPQAGHSQPFSQLLLQQQQHQSAPPGAAPGATAGGGSGGFALEYPDGSCYRGQIVDGRREGEGEWSYVGGRYVGSWRNDLQDGQGMQQWDDGRRYVGEFRGGKFHGQGKMEWVTDAGIMVYEGGYLYDKKEGYGKFQWPDGRTYEGDWRNGKRHGQGTYTNQSGVRRTGDWQADKLVRWLDDAPPPDSTAKQQPNGLAAAATPPAVGSGGLQEAGVQPQQQAEQKQRLSEPSLPAPQYVLPKRVDTTHHYLVRSIPYPMPSDPRELSPVMQALPAYQQRDKVLKAIKRQQVTIVSGETGCGKSCVIPQLLTMDPELCPEEKIVLCTQPRRVAAVSLARFVAGERGQEVGDDVGYHIRLAPEFGCHTRLIYATTAVLIRHMQRELSLESIACLIIDEAHERDIYTDLLLLLLRCLLAEGRLQHLKIILMSATINAEDFEGYLCTRSGNVVSVLGRTHKVEVRWLEEALEWSGASLPQGKGCKGGKKGKGKGKEDDRRSMDRAWYKLKDAGRADGISERTCWSLARWTPAEVYLGLIRDMITFLHREGAKYWKDKTPTGSLGSILVFLGGWGDITKLYWDLMASSPEAQRGDFVIQALHSMMTPEQQEEVFRPAERGKRKIILSTNIAEASVTIDDVIYVLDSGVMKERSYDPRQGLSTLRAKPVSKASLVQRRGRAGRCQPGVCFHLMPSYEEASLEPKGLPAMLSSSLEETILQIKMVLDTPSDRVIAVLADALAQPSEQAISTAMRNLVDMGCLTRGPRAELTILGKAVGSIPIPCGAAKLLFTTSLFKVGHIGAIIAAFLALRAPFQQSLTGATKYDEDAGKRIYDKGRNSDHLAVVTAYETWKDYRGPDPYDFCTENCLSHEALRLADQLVYQLYSLLVRGGYRMDQEIEETAQKEEFVRLALVAGYYPNVMAYVPDDRRWVCGDGQNVRFFRGSVNWDYKVLETEVDSAESSDIRWFIFSDLMSLSGNPTPSVFDSTRVSTNAVLLCANCIALDLEGTGDVYFDTWKASVAQPQGELWQRLFRLRRTVRGMLERSLENRCLAMFPLGLKDDVYSFLTGEQLWLDGLTNLGRFLGGNNTHHFRRNGYDVQVSNWPPQKGGEADDE